MIPPGFDVQGQVHGGLTMGMAPAPLEEIGYDADGNISRRRTCGGP
jgi:CO/xanthine dehydrogenase Mo-binding subunit